MKYFNYHASVAAVHAIQNGLKILKLKLYQNKLKGPVHEKKKTTLTCPKMQQTFAFSPHASFA